MYDRFETHRDLHLTWMASLAQPEGVVPSADEMCNRIDFAIKQKLEYMRRFRDLSGGVRVVDADGKVRIVWTVIARRPNILMTSYGELLLGYIVGGRVNLVSTMFKVPGTPTDTFTYVNGDALVRWAYGTQMDVLNGIKRI